MSPAAVHIVAMNTSTSPRTLADADLAGLLQRLLGPTPAARMWSVSYDGPGARIFTSSISAATFIADEARRRVKAGTPATLAVAILDKGMLPTAGLSAAIVRILLNTSWIRQAADPSYAVAYRLRDQVIDIVASTLEGK